MQAQYEEEIRFFSQQTKTPQTTKTTPKAPTHTRPHTTPTHPFHTQKTQTKKIQRTAPTHTQGTTHKAQHTQAQHTAQHKTQHNKKGGDTGIEPVASCTRSKTHTPRPIAHFE